MKIGLIGYGKMGKEIEPIALDRGHSIAFKITSNDTLNDDLLRSCDVAIEFTRPEEAKKHIQMCFNTKTPVVVGTTGWYDDFSDFELECQKQNGAILPATNFSLGVNIFLEINDRLSQLMNHQNQYDVNVKEIHHTEKLDAPSGTAITITEDILKNINRKHGWRLNESTNSDINITAIREPNVPGTHTVEYSSEIDNISLTHVAHSRKGFALGAVLAAEFLKGKAGVYSMKDVLKF